jgi:hypothetical protein
VPSLAGPGLVEPSVEFGATAKSDDNSSPIPEMELERLELEVSAAKAGLTPVVPHVVRGASGIDHRVSLLFTDGTHLCGFDFYESVTNIEVLRSFAKKFDSGADINIVCLSGETSRDALSLAQQYQMRILGPKAAEKFFIFKSQPVEQPAT